MNHLDKEADYILNRNKNHTTFVNGNDFNTVDKNGNGVIYFENGNIAFGEFKSNYAEKEWEYFDKKKRLRKSEFYLGCEFCVRIICYDKKGVGLFKHALPRF